MLEAIPPGGRDRRLVSAILILATIVLAYLAISLTAEGIVYFGDVLLTFFLAWLLAFIISPVVTRIVALIPRLPRVLATVLVYTAIVAGLIFLILVVAQALSNSITQFVASLPDIRADIGTIVAPMQAWLDSIGLAQVDLATQAQAVLDNLDDLAGQLIVPLQSIAVASVGADRDDAHRVHPVDLHGHRPRPDHGLPLPARPAVLRRGGAAAADVDRPLVRRASCAARR